MGLNVQDLITVFDDWVTEPPPKPVMFKDDPVTLACASYRTWLEHPAQRWQGFDDVVVWQDDREEAQRLKRYYRDRLVMESLKRQSSIEISEFRKKLGALVTDQLTITSKEIGMLHRLPYFYAEDQAVDRVFESSQLAQFHYQGHTQSAVYTLNEKVLRSRRQAEHYDYWLTSNLDECAYYLTIKSDNPMHSLVDSLLAKPIRLTSMLWTKQPRGYHRDRTYYQMANVQVT